MHVFLGWLTMSDSDDKKVESFPDDVSLLEDIRDPQLNEMTALTNQREVTVALLVVNSNEWQAALRLLILTDRMVSPSGSGNIFYAARFRDVNETHRVVLVRQFTAGSGGATGSQEIVHDLLNYFDPRFVVAVGCAFGYDSKKQRMADVLVSTVIAPYDHNRIGADAGSSENRNKPVPIATKLQKLINSFQEQWQFVKVSSEDGDIYGVVHTGSILCGESLVDSEVYKQELAKKAGADMESKKRRVGGEVLIGGEMEGAGMHAACVNRGDLPCVVIKGVSDWGSRQE